MVVLINPPNAVFGGAPRSLTRDADLTAGCDCGCRGDDEARGLGPRTCVVVGLPYLTGGLTDDFGVCLTACRADVPASPTLADVVEGLVTGAACGFGGIAPDAAA